MPGEMSGLHIGVDLGGTKIAGVLLDSEHRLLAQSRLATPQGNYEGTVAAVAELVLQLESASSVTLTELVQPIAVGVCSPGARIPETGLMTGCNSVCLNGKPLQEDLAAALGRPVQLANDADCMALSEWHHYQAEYKGAQDKLGATLFGVILGTGVGGGWVHQGHLLAGPNGLAGEWGHTPMPYFGCDSGRPNPCFELELKLATRHCYCGRQNCIETFLSGPGLQQTHQELWQQSVSCEQLGSTWEAYGNSVDIWDENTSDKKAGSDIRWADAWLGELSGELTGQQQQLASLSLYLDQLARALAQVVNVVDPHTIVLGGGLSNLACLYAELPRRLVSYLFSRQRCATQILPPLGGAGSGVFGAAALARKAW